ncbi:uncharacterized protein SAPINGB_P003289 [Magnusiomyces paraingens]|uniref:J domain-containing protein n=1 Tax=Magnusiomyces paraingens TaxID=2606893 RepID=A0A5E8BR68_9ASCO|nr:uncharacterized protein SAPINGB_P003289 [Saprochaete ingens]VVT52017.1 unnamed protein product [Saprochaete ingens]
MDTNTLAPEITDGVDLYQLLQISYDASEAEIRRAYRKTSIKYHPDKNSGADAAQKFQLLLLALETLTTPVLRTKYDGLMRARTQKSQRDQALSLERRRLQSDLERREAQAAILTSRAFNQHQLKKHHVDTLKEEGVKRRKTKDTNIVSTLTSTEDGSSKDKTSKTVFIKWIASKSDNITESQLCNLLKPYGPIKSVHIVLSNTQPSISKTIKGLILFQSDQSALNCYQLLKNKSFPSNDEFFNNIKSVYYQNVLSSSQSDKPDVEQPYSYTRNVSIEEKIARIRIKLKS